MTRESTFAVSVRRLRLRMIAPYLEKAGWERTADDDDALAIFTKGKDSPRQLLVPTRPEYDDFAELMADVVRKLAEIEGRSERAIIHDLYAGHVDTVRYRMQSLAASRGTLPLEQGILLLEGAKRTLLAAACTVISPETTFHPRVTLPQAEEFIDTCELAQTEEGSFGIVLQCPVQVGTDEALASTTAKDGSIDSPFARRTTDTLLASVATLVDAINKDRIESIVNPQQPSGARLSANLCEALTKMRPEEDEGTLYLSVSWATALLPKQGVSGVVPIRSTLFPRIAEIGRMLRGSAAVQSAPFVARVEALSGTETDLSGQRFGRVRLGVLLEEEDAPIRAYVTLDPKQYRLANQAHMSNQWVVVTGTLNRSARPVTLTGVTQFELLSDKK